MEEKNTSLHLFKKQRKTELLKEFLELINDNTFDFESVSLEEVRKMRGLIKESSKTS